jgi:hypothetical protein
MYLLIFLIIFLPLWLIFIHPWLKEKHYIDFLNPILKKSPIIVSIYIILMVLWHILDSIESTIGVSPVISAILMVSFGFIIAPSKVFLDVFGIILFSAMDPNPSMISHWLFIHAFNIIILLLLSYIFKIVFNFFKKDITNSKT